MYVISKVIVQKVTEGRCGLVVVQKDCEIIGVITDGDIRRAMEHNESGFFSLKAQDIMTQNPKTINEYEKLTVASQVMNDSKVNSLLVVDSDDKLVGVVQFYDLGI